MDQPEGFFDAGPFIGALFITDPRHAEAFPLVEAARLGQILACTTTGVLSEGILPDSVAAALKTMELASAHNLAARRIHDAGHAAAALAAGVLTVCTYDVDDWKLFESDGRSIVGVASSLQRLAGP